MTQNEVLDMAVHAAKEAVDASAALSGEQFERMQAAGLDAEQMVRSLAMSILEEAHDGLEFQDDDDLDDDDDDEAVDDPARRQ